MRVTQKKRFVVYLNLLTILVGCCLYSKAVCQDVNPLINKVKAKLDKVNDYVAEGRMKTDVAFIKAPVGDVKIFYKRPDRFKLKRSDGISMLPKGGIAVGMSRLPGKGNYIAVAAGEGRVANVKVKIVKLLPVNENSDVVLTTLYIDEPNLLIMKTSTTTKENGTFDIEMSYGKFASYSLPDKVVFHFNTKDFKLPKGITMEFDDGESKTAADKVRTKEGKVEIVYSAYIINKGVPDSEFK